MIAEFINGCKNFHFLQKHLITAIVIRLLLELWNASSVGCLSWRCYLSRSFASVAPFLYPKNWFLYWSDHLWFDGFHQSLPTRRHSIIKSDTAIGITFSSFLIWNCHRLVLPRVPWQTSSISFLGNILAVKEYGHMVTIGVGALILLIIGIFF